MEYQEQRLGLHWIGCCRMQIAIVSKWFSSGPAIVSPGARSTFCKYSTNGLGIQFLSQREAIDTDGPLDRAVVVIVSAVAELERSLIVERVRAGMRRAKLDGRRIGRTPLDVDHAALVRDRLSGMSLTQVARKHGLSRSSVVRFVHHAYARHRGDEPNLSILEKDIESGAWRL